MAEARWQLRLSRMIVVPTGDPYHKDSVRGQDVGARLRLAEAAFGGEPETSVSRIEVERSGPSWTCDTLEEIEARFPDSQIHFLMGADAALGFGSWHRPERVLELARIAVAPRSEVERSRLEEVFAGVGAAPPLEFFEMPRMDISSSLVRRRAAAGEPFRHLVPAPVAEIIDNEDLYAD